MDEKKIAVEETTFVLIKVNGRNEFDSVWVDDIEKLIEFENYMNSITNPEDGYFVLVDAKRVPSLNNKSI